MGATLLGLLWGLAQGMRHALEPDHLAAVSTLVAERKSARGAAAYAAAWGLGHALVLLAFGGVLLVLRAHVPAHVAAWFETAVAAMLVVLGVRGIQSALAKEPVEPAPHVHEGPVDHVHVGRWTVAGRPLVVGCIHGLAGTGALAALVLPSMRTAAAGILYMAVYGGGAALGMAALAGAVGVPLARIARTRRGVPVMTGATGVLSLCFGVVWGWIAVGAALAP